MVKDTSLIWIGVTLVDEDAFPHFSPSISSLTKQLPRGDLQLLKLVKGVVNSGRLSTRAGIEVNVKRTMRNVAAVMTTATCCCESAHCASNDRANMFRKADDEELSREA